MPFLAKGGEDLRSDERIMLLFSLMNSLIAASPATAGGAGGASGQAQTDSCHLPIGGPTSSPSSGSSSNSGSAGLMARTYTVIPMTSKVGLLEWVPNTAPLKSIIQNEMAACPIFMANTKNLRDEHGRIDLREIAAFNEIAKLHGCFADGGTKRYHEMFVKTTKDNAEKAFKAAQRLLPDDFIRRHLLKLSSG